MDSEVLHQRQDNGLSGLQREGKRWRYFCGICYRKANDYGIVVQ